MSPKNLHLSTKILLGMALGFIFGVIIKSLPPSTFIDHYFLQFFNVVGIIFFNVLKMLVVPVVFVSLVCGICQLKSGMQLGRMAVKTVVLYLITTAIAITIALSLAASLGIGSGADLQATSHFAHPATETLSQTLISIFPSNPFDAFAKGNMLQIIVFSVLFGAAIGASGKRGERVAKFFVSMNDVVMELIMMIMRAAPFGIFCIVTHIAAKSGFGLINELLSYFATVIVALFIHWFFTYGAMIKYLARLNPITFFKHMYSAMLFAFGVSSSSASIPVTLRTCEQKLGVDNSVAAFVVPMGATINMDGTAIMQGVATVFIAHAYGIDIGMSGYLMVVLMSTLASIGTAGVPGVGIIMLSMVLTQVGLPVEGIGLIIGVDRLIDMARTAVNITGDCAVACVVGKSEKAFSDKIYNNQI